MFVPSASSTTDTDSILPSCLAFSSVELKAFDEGIEHTKTLPSVITQTGVTLLLLSQSHSLLWRPAKCHSPEMCVEMNSQPVSCVGLWARRCGDGRFYMSIVYWMYMYICIYKCVCMCVSVWVCVNKYTVYVCCVSLFPCMLHFKTSMDSINYIYPLWLGLLV